MRIYRIVENSRTGFESFDMPDNYQLQVGDYTDFPAGAYTPIKAVDGKLVGSTLEEHEAFETQWLKDHPQDASPVVNVKPQPSAMQKANAQLMMQLATMQAQQAQVNATILSELAVLKATK